MMTIATALRSRDPDKASAINTFAMAHNSDPMVVQARALGMELEREQLKQKYENAMLVLAFSVTVNIGAIIYFLTRGLQ